MKCFNGQIRFWETYCVREKIRVWCNENCYSISVALTTWDEKLLWTFWRLLLWIFAGKHSLKSYTCDLFQYFIFSWFWRPVVILLLLLTLRYCVVYWSEKYYEILSNINLFTLILHIKIYLLSQIPLLFIDKIFLGWNVSSSQNIKKCNLLYRAFFRVEDMYVFETFPLII